MKPLTTEKEVRELAGFAKLGQNLPGKICLIRLSGQPLTSKPLRLCDATKLHVIDYGQLCRICSDASKHRWAVA